jgi:protein involved in polysaccharide export with SLBB domain
MNISHFHKLHILASIFFIANLALAQELTQEFLEGLDPVMRDQLENQNSSDEDPELEALFRSETSLEKNKEILSKLKTQISDLDKKFNNLSESSELQRFGENFFSSVQSSFMPINIPNIDSNYIVDVGDEFSILLTGKQNKELSLVVQRDGTLIIPEFGKISVAGFALQETEAKISNFISSISLGVNSFITLSEIRDVQLFLIGGVESPGVYTLSGGSNILHALNIAGGISENGSYRLVEHRRNGKVINKIDLYQTLVFGYNFGINSLRSGDVIFVAPPSFQVPISGGVNRPAIYEILPNETLEDIIELAGGFSESFYGHNAVKVFNKNVGSNSETQVKISELAKFTINPRTSIEVPAYSNAVEAAREVNITGMVQRPGKYSIEQGESLGNLIQRAGGYKEGAYVYGGALFRENASTLEKEYAQINYADTINFLISSIGKPGTSFSSSAVELLIQELKSQKFQGRVLTDFNFLNNKGISLLDGDNIVIPPMQRIVYTFGDFKSQSNVEYNPNYSISDYINISGGLKESARNFVLVIDPDGKTHVYKRRLFDLKSNIDIYPGSIIYAPREIGKLDGLLYASTVAPVLSSLALSLASLNSISD